MTGSRRTAVRIVYSDLDGTMVGPWGCFFRAADRSPDLAAARALVDLLAADVTLVLVSGRTRAQLAEAARCGTRCSAAPCRRTCPARWSRPCTPTGSSGASSSGTRGRWSTTRRGTSATDLARRGLSPDDAVAIGDSSSDLAMAPYVRRFFLTANGLRSPAAAAGLAGLDNVTVCAGEVGAGWAEAVRWALAT